MPIVHRDMNSDGEEKIFRKVRLNANSVSKQIKKLKVYRGAKHPHEAQKPVPFEITQVAQ